MYILLRNYRRRFISSSHHWTSSSSLRYVSYKPQPRRPVPKLNSQSAPPSTGTPPRSSRTSNEHTVKDIFHARKLPLLAAGVVALGLGVYSSLIISSFTSLDQSTCATIDCALPTGRPPGFNSISARKFDQCLDASEKSMGITALRRQLGELCSGHVLEVAMGTGRNLTFYDWTRLNGQGSQAQVGLESQLELPTAMASYTGVDVSPEMLEVAVEKLPEVVTSLKTTSPKPAQPAPSQSTLPQSYSFLNGKIRLAQCDIQATIPPADDLAPHQGGYDAVVQTFGLCSVRDPAQVIANLARVVKPGSGRIILIEHGRSRWGIINTLLDWSASAHFIKYGCWWNRDIVGIVERTADTIPGLRVINVKRPYITQLGTTVWLELVVDPPS